MFYFWYVCRHPISPCVIRVQRTTRQWGEYFCNKEESFINLEYLRASPYIYPPKVSSLSHSQRGTIITSLFVFFCITCIFFEFESYVAEFILTLRTEYNRALIFEDFGSVWHITKLSQQSYNWFKLFWFGNIFI